MYKRCLVVRGYASYLQTSMGTICALISNYDLNTSIQFYQSG